MALDLEEIDRSMSFHPSEATTISCGTVTIDPQASKVLLIWNKKLHIHQLPKGRKNIGEDMLSAALRETYEETGVHATPLRLKIATRATPPSEEPSSSSLPSSPGSSPASATTERNDDHDCPESTSSPSGGSGTGSSATTATCSCEITEGRLSTEFLGCCRYPDPQSSIPAMKVVFYFAATADSTLPRGPGSPGDWEKLETVWTAASEAAGTLRFKAEAEIVRKALEDARRSGYPIPG